MGLGDKRPIYCLLVIFKIGGFGRVSRSFDVFKLNLSFFFGKLAERLILEKSLYWNPFHLLESFTEIANGLEIRL